MIIKYINKDNIRVLKTNEFEYQNDFKKNENNIALYCTLDI